MAQVRVLPGAPFARWTPFPAAAAQEATAVSEYAPISTYREVISPPKWFVVAIALLALAPLWGVQAALRDDSLSTARRVTLTAAAPVVAGMLLWLALVGSHLTVEVVAERVRFRFGPFGRTLRSNDITAVTAEPYNAWAFGGWGWRLGWGGAQAFTVPFLRSGVMLGTARGRFYLSSRTPERLAEAVRYVAHLGTQ
ncbi:MAG: hypothetical protein DWI58_00365 [Chloroflexi bacterium]|nr:MAG: hypothetical protein DWI58_00365 [Chloroflexota bacterium]